MATEVLDPPAPKIGTPPAPSAGAVHAPVAPSGSPKLHPGRRAGLAVRRFGIGVGNQVKSFGKIAKWGAIAALTVPVVAGVASYMRNRNAYNPNTAPQPDMDAELPPVLDFTPPASAAPTLMGEPLNYNGPMGRRVMEGRGMMPQQQAPGAMNPEMSAVDPNSIQDLGTPPTRV